MSNCDDGLSDWVINNPSVLWVCIFSLLSRERENSIFVVRRVTCQSTADAGVRLLDPTRPLVRWLPVYPPVCLYYSTLNSAWLIDWLIDKTEDLWPALWITFSTFSKSKTRLYVFWSVLSKKKRRSLFKFLFQSTAVFTLNWHFRYKIVAHVMLYIQHYIKIVRYWLKYIWPVALVIAWMTTKLSVKDVHHGFLSY